MVKVLLISYAGYPYTPSSLMPDNGLANLAGTIISKGHSALILDYGTLNTMKRLFPQNLKEELSQLRENKSDLGKLQNLLQDHQKKELDKITHEVVEKIKTFKPDIVGFKLWWGDGLIGSIHIANRIKEFDKDIFLIGGGPHVDFFRELIIKKDNIFDLLVYGEGEDTIIDIIELFKGRKEIDEVPNIIYLKEDRVQINPQEWIKDLDVIGLPEYSEKIYPSMSNDEKIKIITLDESRGCPFKCSFCIQPVKSGKSLRLIKPSKVVDTIIRLKNDFGFSTYRFAGSSTPGKHIQLISEEIIKRKLEIKFSAFTRTNIANSEFFNTMKSAGLQALFFGIESGSQKILDSAMNKQVSVDSMKKVLISSKKAGIYTIASIIYPSPFEDEKTTEETFNFLVKTNPDSVIINPVGVFPHTAWLNNSEEYGIKIESDDYLNEFMLYYPMVFFPPHKWKPLPYIINGKNYSQLSQQSMILAERIRNQGITTQISDEIFLMSNSIAMGAGEFGNMTRDYIMTGDWQNMATIVKKINDQILKYD